MNVAPTHGRRLIKQHNTLLPKISQVTLHFGRLATCWTVRGVNPGGSKRFSLLIAVQTCHGAHSVTSIIRPGFFSRDGGGVKRPGRSVDPPPSSAVVENE